jgi:hypothetical protein
MAEPEPTPEGESPPSDPARGRSPRALIGFGRGGAPGPDTIIGRLLARPGRYGYVALAIGLGLVAIGLTRGHVTSGPAVVVIGLGWIASESVPPTRPRDRLIGIGASMALAIVVETALRWSGLLGR